MPPRKTWVFNPGVGGKKIPDPIKHVVEERIKRTAEKHFKGKYTRLIIRFKGKFCYIDAYREPNVFFHLCRLRYFDDDNWGFAFYTYSHEKYELSVYANGKFTGKPEDAFLLSAVYLTA